MTNPGDASGLSTQWSVLYSCDKLQSRRRAIDPTCSAVQGRYGSRSAVLCESSSVRSAVSAERHRQTWTRKVAPVIGDTRLVVPPESFACQPRSQSTPDRAASGDLPRKVAVGSLLPADSPRLNGIDEDHARALAETGQVLPPILVHGSSMRIIDGMHRARAAQIRGHETMPSSTLPATTRRRSSLECRQT